MKMLAIDKTCRTCGSQAKQSDDFIPIFKITEDDQISVETVPEEIIQLLAALNLNFMPDDDLPQRICVECLTTLAAIKEYQQHCEDVQQALDSYFPKKNVSDELTSQHQIEEMVQNEVHIAHNNDYTIENPAQIAESKETMDTTIATSFKDTQALEVFDVASNKPDAKLRLIECEAAGNIYNTGNAILAPRRQENEYELTKQTVIDSDTKAGSCVNIYLLLKDDTSSLLNLEQGKSSEVIDHVTVERDKWHMHSEEQSRGGGCADETMAENCSTDNCNGPVLLNSDLLNTKITTDSFKILQSSVPSIEESIGNQDIMQDQSSKCDVSLKQDKKKIIIRNRITGVRRSLPKTEECPFCHSVFAKASMHVTKCSMRNVEICQYCNAFIKTPEELKDHIDQVHPERFFQCEICSAAFETQAKKNEHARQTHNEPICKICDQKFSSVGGLQRHNKRWHLNAGHYECAICKKTLVTAYSLEMHLLRHANDRSFKCKYCQKGFMQACQLKAHERIHTGERPFLCDICGKGFRTNDMRKTHRLVHTGDETPNFICDICDATFQVKERYLFHKLKHATNQIPATKRPKRKIQKRRGENNCSKGDNVLKRHVCPTCGKDFRSLFGLDVHVKKHKEVRPFGCEQCGDRFKRMEHLRSHIERLHSNLGKQIPCDVCGRKFLKQFDLNAHKKLHTGEKSIKCRYCPAVFRWSSDRRTHEISHTGDKSYVCFVCNEAYSYLHELQKHYESHSQEELNDVERKIIEGLEKDGNRKEENIQFSEISEDQLFQDVIEDLAAVDTIALEPKIDF